MPQPTTNIVFVNIEDNASIFNFMEILVKAVLFFFCGTKSILQGDEKMKTMQAIVRYPYRSNEKKMSKKLTYASE